MTLYITIFFSSLLSTVYFQILEVAAACPGFIGMVIGRLGGGGTFNPTSNFNCLPFKLIYTPDLCDGLHSETADGIGKTLTLTPFKLVRLSLQVFTPCPKIAHLQTINVKERLWEKPKENLYNPLYRHHCYRLHIKPYLLSQIQFTLHNILCLWLLSVLLTIFQDCCMGWVGKIMCYHWLG